MSFEDKRNVTLEIATIDIFVDLCFSIDLILTFFIPAINIEGKLVITT